MRPTLKSAAAAVFIGGCAAAGIAVASASTPASQPVAPASVQQTEVGSTMSVEMQHHGRDLHQNLHRGRDAHQGANGVAAANDTVTPSLAPSSEPVDDQSTEPVEVTSTEPVEDNQDSAEAGDDNQSSQPAEDTQSSEPAEDSQSSEPGDDNGTDVPGDGSGDSSGSSGGSDG